MLKFRHLILLLILAFANNISAFEPKVTYAKEPHPLFQEYGKLFVQTDLNKQNSDILQQLKEISRENIKNLPDEIDFGNVTFDDIKPSNKNNRYQIYNYVLEGLSINAGLELYGTMESISVFPAATSIGSYVSQIIFKWEEADPSTEIVKRYSKVLTIKANIVESNAKSNRIISIKEIWYSKTGISSYEDNSDIESGNINISQDGYLIIE